MQYIAYIIAAKTSDHALPKLSKAFGPKEISIKNYTGESLIFFTIDDAKKHINDLPEFYKEILSVFEITAEVTKEV